MVRCNLCNQELGRITHTHLWYKHRVHFSEFIKRFPNVNAGLIPWNKGKTKETHPILSRLSSALKAKKEWNFSKWQRRNKIHYENLKKDRRLAELIGTALGDGTLEKFPRTERLRIICNSKEKEYILHIADMLRDRFKKLPHIFKRKKKNAIDIYIYQCEISKRLGLPTGDKIENNVGIPSWIKYNKKFAISCLKGLFETDGCFVEDEDNYTQIMEFKNNCRRLREDVYSMLCRLGYHPQFGKNYIRLARRIEVYSFKELISFRNYS